METDHSFAKLAGITDEEMERFDSLIPAYVGWRNGTAPRMRDVDIAFVMGLFDRVAKVKQPGPQVEESAKHIRAYLDRQGL
jgi:hypothetical protein